MRADLLKAAALMLVVASLTACAGAGKAFKLADQAARARKRTR